jgi:hypothetical protein
VIIVSDIERQARDLSAGQRTKYLQSRGWYQDQLGNWLSPDHDRVAFSEAAAIRRALQADQS